MGSVRGLRARSFHRIAFNDWGPQDAERAVICVQALTRNGTENFDILSALAGQRAIVFLYESLPGCGQTVRKSGDIGQQRLVLPPVFAPTDRLDPRQ